MPDYIVNLTYLVASILFIYALKGLSHPRTAVRGNLFGAIGMLLAIVVTLWDQRIVSFEVILAGLIIGAAIGAVLALKIKMTAMPQLVALFNGFGGGTSTLVAGAVLLELQQNVQVVELQISIASVFSGIIGTVTFWGSLVAFGKLQGIIGDAAIRFKSTGKVNIIMAIASIGLGVWVVLDPVATQSYWVMVAAATVLGVMLVIPIGGADMPVVIALLNSFSGLAAAATGFVLQNNVLIIAGSLVGASGYILSIIMCRAMNRTLAKVLFSEMEVSAKGLGHDDVYGGKVKSATAEEVALLFDGASRVVIVPGYGMAVAQAQHVVRDLAEWLEAHGIETIYGIHPVAGRMPGHMNVLLAEAKVDYEKLVEMKDVNPILKRTDVAIVIGANDVVNPLARNSSGTPLSGMPIIDVDMARFVVVIKRSLSPGFAGIPNPLFAADNTVMFFGDARKAITDLLAAVKEAT
ncbi:MAG: NAD(P)(+) transhydrogenase (Re/Si-specific) subunit beta [candidate division Zixibacteria bacterium]